MVFALSHPHYGAELEGLVQSEFAEEGSLARAFTLVHAAGGMSAARSLARQEADLVRGSHRAWLLLCVVCRLVSLKKLLSDSRYVASWRACCAGYLC